MLSHQSFIDSSSTQKEQGVESKIPEAATSSKALQAWDVIGANSQFMDHSRIHAVLYGHGCVFKMTFASHIDGYKPRHAKPEPPPIYIMSAKEWL